jgi:hypothetical protein
LYFYYTFLSFVTGRKEEKRKKRREKQRKAKEKRGKEKEKKRSAVLLQMLR